MEVSRTLLSPAYGAFQPAPLVRSHAQVVLPMETATALVTRSGPVVRERRSLSNPQFEEGNEANRPRLTRMAHAAVQVYELDYDGQSHGFFFALGDGAWSFGPWSSDARVLYCCIDEEKLAHLVVIGGTQVAWQEQPLLKAVGSEFFEWRHEGGVMNAGADAFSVTAAFEKLTGGSHLSSPDLTHSSIK
jgi:hypothetical protein